MANGAVRCGSCATVFSAFSGLQQNTLDDDLRTDEEFLSPTIQTQELASIEEFEGPQLDESPAAGSEEALEAEMTDPSVEQVSADFLDVDAPLEAEDGDAGVPIVDTPAGVEQASSADAEADDPLELGEDDEPEMLTPEEPPELAADETIASESSDQLQFDAPADDWAQLLSEIEQSTEAQTSTEDEAIDTDDDSADEAEAEAVGFWNVGNPAATESWTEIEMSGDGQVSHERIAVGEAETALAMNAPIDDAQTDAELDISAEQVDATLSAEPDLVEALEVGLQAQGDASTRSYVWTLSSIALALALALQVVHHFRVPLASETLIGPVVRGSYALFGVDLMPEWDLDQYEILNWVATEAGLGNLRITAQIRNNGPRTQPYPHIHLELKDRWEAVVGSRVFEPVEYLQPETDISSPMVAGVTVPADFAVVDPGQDAYGFELDVCIQRNAGWLSCASEQVFE